MGYWDEKKEKIKQKYPIITDDDLIFCEGKEKEMVERLGFKAFKYRKCAPLSVNCNTK